VGSTNRSPIGDRRGYDGCRSGRRGGRRDGVQQGLPRGRLRSRFRRRRHRLRILMRRVRLLQSGLQVADVFDHPLDHLEFRQLPLARHVRHEGAQLGEVSGDFLGLEVASGAADPQTVVQHAAMVGRHSAAHRAHHHRLHAGSGGDQRITRPESIDPALGSFLSTLVREHTAAAGSG